LLKHPELIRHSFQAMLEKLKFARYAYLFTVQIFFPYKPHAVCCFLRGAGGKSIWQDHQQ
jgi:hypothetical protein